jgi:multiple sugar transport system permease protein
MTTIDQQEQPTVESPVTLPSKARRQRAFSAVYLSPGWLLLLGIVLIPLALGLWISFRNGSLLTPTSQFVGLKNYTNLLASSAFWDAIKVTLLISVLSLAIQLPLGFLLAVVINRELVGTRVFRSSLLMPLLLTPVAVGLMWRLMLNVDNGVIDGMLQAMGMPAVDWLGNRTMAVVSVVLVDSWQNTPFVMLLMLAGLQSLPVGPLEAARVDGATILQTYRHVILPLLAPVGLVVVMIRVIESVKLFDIIYILTSGGPGTATQNVSLLDYRLGFTFLQTSKAAALGVIITIALIPMYRLWKRANAS